MCFRCGDATHLANKCRVVKTECHFCKRIGHIQKVCRKRKGNEAVHQVSAKDGVPVGLLQGPTQRAVLLDPDAEADQQQQEWSKQGVGETVKTLYTTSESCAVPIVLPTTVDGVPLEFELDTGSSLSLLPLHQYQEHFQHIPLERSEVVLRTYSGELLKAVGCFRATVQVNQQQEDLTLVVITSSGPALFGRTWLQHFQLDWPHLVQVHKMQSHTLEPVHGKIRAVHDKIQAVQDAPAPTTVSKLRTFLGLVNHYGKLIPNISTMLAPLRILLRKGAKWKWGSDQVRAFKAVKATLKKSKCSFDFDLL